MIQILRSYFLRLFLPSHLLTVDGIIKVAGAKQKKWANTQDCHMLEYSFRPFNKELKRTNSFSA